MIETEFNFVRGTTYSRNFNLTDYDANIDEMYFTVKESEKDRLPVIKKTLGNGITQLETEEENTKSYNLLINSDDTENLQVDKPYYFDVKIVTYGENTTIKKVIIKGTITLSANITWKYNES